jgi:hypothetical protein
MIDAQILETTYFDICTIKRKEKAKDPETGVTITKEVTISKDIRCALSKKDSQVMNQTEVGSLSYTHLLFTGPNVDILAGDSVDVTSFGITETFIASKPFRYSSHKEVYLTLKERV